MVFVEMKKWEDEDRASDCLSILLINITWMRKDFDDIIMSFKNMIIDILYNINNDRQIEI